MKEVNRHNYEVWMIDYFDGKLTAAEITAFFAFLDEHPDIREEFDQFELTPLAIETSDFPEKAALRKDPVAEYEGIHEDNYEEWFIAFHEGDLDDHRKGQVEGFLGLNPHLDKEFMLAGKLKLQADGAITFKAKAGLKRVPGVAIYRWASAAAAAAVLFMLAWFFNDQQNGTAERTLAKISELEARTNGFRAPADPPPQLKVLPVGTPERLIARHETLPNEREEREIHAMQSLNTTADLIAESDYRNFLPATPAGAKGEVLAFSVENPESREKNGPLARIIRNLTGKISVDKNKRASEENPRDPTFVRLLDQGITVFNTLTGSDSELVRSYDGNGKLTRYTFEGESISWSRDVASRQQGE